MDILETRPPEAPDPWADFSIATAPPEIATVDHGDDTVQAYHIFTKKYWFGNDFDILVYVSGKEGGQEVTRIVPLGDYARFLRKQRLAALMGILGYSRGPKQAPRSRAAADNVDMAKTGTGKVPAAWLPECKKPADPTTPAILDLTADTGASIGMILEDGASASTLPTDAGSASAKPAGKRRRPNTWTPFRKQPEPATPTPTVERQTAETVWTPADIVANVGAREIQEPRRNSGKSVWTLADIVAADTASTEGDRSPNARESSGKQSEREAPKSGEKHEPQTTPAAYDRTLHEFVERRGDTPAAVFDMLMHLAIEQRNRVKRPISDTKIYMTTWCVPRASILTTLLAPEYGAASMDRAGNISLSIPNLLKYKIGIIARLADEIA